MRAANRHHQTLIPLMSGGNQGLVRNGLVAEYRFDESKNLLKYSQQFDNAAWVKQRSSVTANTTTAPDGTTTADALIEDSTAGNTHQMQGSVTLDDNTVYTLSIHAKASTRSYIVLNLIDKNNTSRYAFFDLSSGIALGTSGTISQTITAMSDGWYRCCVTANSNSGATSPVCQIRLSATGLSSSYDGDGTSGIYIWGAQLDLGSVARTYYPTRDKQHLMDYSRPRKNLLLPNQANACEDGTTGGFAKYNAGDAVTASAGEVDEWQGTYCAKVVTGNATTYEGMYTNPTIHNLSPGKVYTASAYVRGASGGESIKITLFQRKEDNTAVDGTSSDALTLTTGWQRITVSGTFGATSRAAYIAVRCPLQSSSTFYVDGLQLEEGSTATAWEAPPNIGICGSTTGEDTNDPTWTGQGASFTTDDYIDLGFPAQFAFSTGYTIICVGMATADASQILIGYANAAAATGTGWYIAKSSTAGRFLHAHFTSDGNRVLHTLDGYPVGSYYFLSGVWDGSKIYFNKGVSFTSTGSTAASLKAPTTSAKIGGVDTTYLSGTVAYIAVYSRALTQAEITQNYNYLKGYLLRERGISI